MSRPGPAWNAWRYGPGYSCQEFTMLLEELPNEWGSPVDGDYVHDYDHPGTTRVTPRANETT